MKRKTILIVGGAGYIGSHVNKMLHQAGYDTLVLDNLSRGSQQTVLYGTFIKGDINDLAFLNHLFESHPIDAVMHFAGLTDVGESMQEPLKYYQNNVCYTLNLLEAMRQHHVKVFIFSSSAAIFGMPQTDKISEEHPFNPINPYGQSKLIVETILKDLKEIRFCCLRYFNAAGGDPDGEIKNYKTKETNLIPIILKSLKERKKVTIFGTDYPTFDGTCIRDYVHIHDLGTAHIAAMEKLFQGAKSNFYNLGNGQGFSIRQVIDAVESVTGIKVAFVEGERRPGDPPILVASAEKAKRELGWSPLYPDLDQMISHAWKCIHN